MDPTPIAIAEYLHHHVIGAGVEVRGDRGGGLLDRIHADDAAGQTLGAPGYEIGLVEALPDPGITVVRQTE